jgi:hypothetical protein
MPRVRDRLSDKLKGPRFLGDHEYVGDLREILTPIGVYVGRGDWDREVP